MNPLIPHSRPTLPEPEAWEAIMARMVPGWVADGACTEAFEKSVADYLGCAGGVAVNSGTNALHLALVAAGVEPGSEVLIPAYCCAAILNAVHQAGANPVLVDAERGGFNLCPDDAARRLTPRTSAVVVAHLFGAPAPVERFRSLGVPIIEDCAQSLGARRDGIPIGGQGDFAITSFYATKVITTGHGGFAGAASPERADLLRDLVDYDNRDAWQPRFSYRISEMQAALGLSQIDQLPYFLHRRRQVADYYDVSLIYKGASGEGLRGRGMPLWSNGSPGGPARGGTREGEPPRNADPEEASAEAGRIFYRYVVRVTDADRFIAGLRELGVDAKRPVYRPLHHYVGGEYPHAEAAHREVVSLPIYPTLAGLDAERVVTSVLSVAARETRAG